MNVLFKKRSGAYSWGAGSAFTLCLALFLLADSAHAVEDLYAPIKKRLIRDGFSSNLATQLFQPPPAPIFKVIAQTFRLRESKLNYDQFLAPAAIMKAQRFLREYSSILAEAEKTYGVDRCVIVGILLVETQFGNYTGRTPTLAVFSTFALMSEQRYRDKVWSLLTPQDRKRWGREPFDAKLEKRAEWAYEEICALARLASTQSVRVESLQGSVMGAVGWPQFLPTSLVRYGADGNNDGRIDLYESKDAVFSIANYLRGHGWCQARTRAEKEDVIHHYNKSRPYVNAVLGVADRIR